MDSIEDPNILIDSEGVCNYCRDYEGKYSETSNPNFYSEAKIDSFILEIKQGAKNTAYDCIIGLSGGIDSSYLALKCHDWGLNPLMVHFDNGWNSELAVQNIQSIVGTLGYDLHTYVVNWDEYRDLQNAYIQSGVIDWEVPTDHGFYAVLYHTAFKYKIPNILAGFNHQTEGILDSTTSWKKQDLLNLLDIHNKYGSVKLNTYPVLSFWKMIYYQKYLKFKVFSPLELFHYDVNIAKKEIMERLHWRDYGGKHYESIFTRFYQGYILPVKFNKDKRKSHLSSLINSGFIDRDFAINELSKPIYPSQELLNEDISFFKKKMGYSDSDFDTIMKIPQVPHLDFKSYLTRHYAYHKKVFSVIDKIRAK
jgi:N-acetyl sugar amidotransferase